MVVVFYNSGQLGNRLFYFSHFIALSQIKNQRVLALFFDEYSRFFEGTHDNVVGFFPKLNVRIKSSFVQKSMRYVLWKLFVLAKKYKWNNRFISVYKPPHDGKMETINYSVQNLVNDPSLKAAWFTFYDGGYPWYDHTCYPNFEQAIKPFFKPLPEFYESTQQYLCEQRQMG
ncbi:MAG: hypothetical protein AAFO94_15300, partial [Bacteroidota bacterium]